MTRVALLAVLFLVPVLAGCIGEGSEWDMPLTDTEFAAPSELNGTLAAAELTWPDFTGATLQVLDHGAFWSCADAGAIFESLTGAKVECTSEDDTGSALNRAIIGRGDPEFDVLYGIDNILLQRAIDERLFTRYTPQLANRVQEEFVFFGIGHEDAWPATPVDFGVIALNVDSAHGEFGVDKRNTTIDNLFDVRSNADLFVTQDPRTSTPGLGFMLLTLALFGEDGPGRSDPYDWLDYWRELFENGVLITSGWTEAYVTHFSGGYGVWEDGHLGDRPIVTSYTNSPAYEVYNGGTAADVLLTHGAAPAAFQQVQTMGILAGTDQLAIAQAWIEFTLTDDFQALAAPTNAIYPVVASVDASDVYGDVDPEPESFDVIEMEFTKIGASLDSWLQQWTALCEEFDCA